jgi:hypothetical protein
MRSLSILLFLRALGAAMVAANNDYFAVPTDQAGWDECGLDYTARCPPTMTIEQAACEAPLVVNGRVLQAVNGETREDTVVQIQVNYLSELYASGGVDRRTVQKWGAGLENEDAEDGTLFNTSGFFTTWITAGFNNTPTDLAPAGFGTTPCGTRSPRSQETLFFFLQALPENQGKKIEFADDRGALNVNFTLSTSILQTGMVEANADTYQFVAQGAFNDDNRLDGNCEVVYCCYNQDCGRCASVLAQVSDDFQCRDTLVPPDGSPSLVRGSTMASLLVLGLASAISVMMG